MQTSSFKETEIKILGVSYPLLVRDLKKLGAVKKGSVYLRDRYIDTPEKTLKKNNKSARLRSYGGETFEITVKSKLKSKKYKIRKEENTSVPTLEIGKMMLHMMGFEYIRYKEKIRVTYILDDTTIDVDFYDDMPPVVEIEGTKKQLEDCIRKLRLHNHEQVTRGAKKLLKHYGKKVKKVNLPMSKVAM